MASIMMNMLAQSVQKCFWGQFVLCRTSEQSSLFLLAKEQVEW